jgi:hypothetical protein
VKPSFRTLLMVTFAAAVAGGAAGALADFALPDTTPARKVVLGAVGLVGNAAGLYWALRR